MRHFLLCSVLSASVSFAQAWGGYVGSGNPTAQPGVWTGYVNGWVNEPSRVAVFPLELTRQTQAYRQLNFLSRNAAIAPGYYYPGFYPSDDAAAQQAAQYAAQVAAQQEQKN